MVKVYKKKRFNHVCITYSINIHWCFLIGINYYSSAVGAQPSSWLHLFPLKENLPPSVTFTAFCDSLSLPHPIWVFVRTSLCLLHATQWFLQSNLEKFLKSQGESIIFPSRTPYHTLLSSEASTTWINYWEIPLQLGYHLEWFQTTCVKMAVLRLPWWSSVWDSAFQPSRCRFDPWSGN